MRRRVLAEPEAGCYHASAAARAHEAGRPTEGKAPVKRRGRPVRPFAVRSWDDGLRTARGAPGRHPQMPPRGRRPCATASRSVHSAPRSASRDGGLARRTRRDCGAAGRRALGACAAARSARSRRRTAEPAPLIRVGATAARGAEGGGVDESHQLRRFVARSSFGALDVEVGRTAHACSFSPVSCRRASRARDPSPGVSSRPFLCRAGAVSRSRSR